MHSLSLCLSPHRSRPSTYTPEIVCGHHDHALQAKHIAVGPSNHVLSRPFESMSFRTLRVSHGASFQLHRSIPRGT